MKCVRPPFLHLPGSMSKPGGGMGGVRGGVGGGGYGKWRVSRHVILGSAVNGGSALPEKPNALSHEGSLYMPTHRFNARRDTATVDDVPSPPPVTRAP